MSHGMRTGLLRLKSGTKTFAGTLFGLGRNTIEDHELCEYQLRDLGVFEGRVSPSTVQRVVRSDAWEIIERSPPWL